MLLNNIYLTKCKYGDFILIKNDLISIYMSKYGQFAPIEIEFLKKNIKENDIVLEFGTNIGSHTIPISKFVGENGKVICFEPQKDIFMILCTNIVINQRNNIIPYNYGIGNEEKMLMLSDIENGSSINNITGEITKIYNTGGQTMLNLKEGNIIEKQIKIKNLNYFKELEYLEKIDLIKMDVEGMEIQILYELEYYIDKFKPKLFIEISSVEKTIEFLQKKDYNIYQFITSYLSYEKLDNNFKTDSNFFAIHKSKDTENYNLKPILSKDDINYTYFVEDTIKL